MRLTSDLPISAITSTLYQPADSVPPSLPWLTETRVTRHPQHRVIQAYLVAMKCVSYQGLQIIRFWSPAEAHHFLIWKHRRRGRRLSWKASAPLVSASFTLMFSMPLQLCRTKWCEKAQYTVTFTFLGKSNPSYQIRTKTPHWICATYSNEWNANISC